MDPFKKHDAEGFAGKLRPVPITELDFLNAMLGPSDMYPGLPKDVAELVQKEEIRVHRIMQHYMAWLQPIGKAITSGGLLWEVRFPKGTKWKNGPIREGARLAILENYKLNKKFPGFLELPQSPGDALITADAKDQAADRKEARQLENQAHEDAAEDEHRQKQLQGKELIQVEAVGLIRDDQEAK